MFENNNEPTLAYKLIPTPLRNQQPHATRYPLVTIKRVRGLLFRTQPGEAPGPRPSGISVNEDGARMLPPGLLLKYMVPFLPAQILQPVWYFKPWAGATVWNSRRQLVLYK